MGIVAITFAALGFAAVVSLWSAFIASILWGWFAVPLLGLPPMTTAGILGLSLVLGAIRPSPDVKSPDDWPEVVSKALLAPLVALAMGAIVKLFI